MILRNNYNDNNFQVTEKCKQIGSNVAQFGYVTTDMNDFKQIENLVRSSIEQLGGLDVVIINHAHMPDMKNFDDLQLAMKVCVIREHYLLLFSLYWIFVKESYLVPNLLLVRYLFGMKMTRINSNYGLG